MGFAASRWESRDRADLTAEVRQQLLPAYRKSHAKPYNDYYDFVFDEDHEDTASWTLDDADHVVIDTVCTTDPKELDPHGWTAEFKGTWDVSDAKFIQQSIARIPPRPNQTLERTADRRDNLFSMTSTLNPEAPLALVSGRSACSR